MLCCTIDIKTYAAVLSPASSQLLLTHNVCSGEHPCWATDRILSWTFSIMWRPLESRQHLERQCHLLSCAAPFVVPRRASRSCQAINSEGRNHHPTALTHSIPPWLTPWYGWYRHNNSVLNTKSRAINNYQPSCSSLDLKRHRQAQNFFRTNHTTIVTFFTHHLRFMNEQVILRHYHHCRFHTSQTFHQFAIHIQLKLFRWVSRQISHC